MGVRFPRVHIAASVVNRILNIRDEIKMSMPQQQPTPADQPVVPDPMVEGADLDIRTREPVPQVTDDETVVADAAPIATGTNLLDTL